MNNYFERMLEQDEERLEEDFNNGLLSTAEYNKELRELQKEFRAFHTEQIASGNLSM